VRDDVRTGLSLLEARGLPFDVVIENVEQLRHVATIAEQHPGLSLVIDHLAKPPVGETDASAWQQGLAKCAAYANVHGKLSGLYRPGTASTRWNADLLRPYVEFALDVFGPGRLMLGSDWPVCLAVGDYHRVWSVLLELTEALGDEDRAAVRGGTAARFYRLCTDGG
jgi:L-fuconolactonase